MSEESFDRQVTPDDRVSMDISSMIFWAALQVRRERAIQNMEAEDVEVLERMFPEFGRFEEESEFSFGVAFRIRRKEVVDYMTARNFKTDESEVAGKWKEVALRFSDFMQAR